MTSRSAPDWQRVEELFARAVELDGPARTTLLDRECHGDEHLRAEVEGLLACDDPEFLTHPVARITTDPLLVAGTRIDRYRLVRELGEGGMGSVWLAERDDDLFDQEVAIKVLKRGLDTGEILRRFAVERRLLAQLDHPHIARLLDGGATADGRPYLVLEHVQGAALDRFVKDRNLPLRARLQLFVAICTAVEHAHRHLIVHRDLKPSNVLVTDTGTPKLLDFGIAKMLDPRPDGASTIGDGHPMTPQYASPEQLLGSPITTASDVYTLGLLLFELLTDSRPFPHRNRSSTSAAAIAGEQPLPRPSSVATRERATRVRGDLDTVCLTAIADAPADRYPSARELALDVERWLDGLPIAARPPSWLYRAHRFVGRNRVGVALAGAALVAIVATAITASVFWARAASARDVAEHNADRARWQQFVASLAAAEAALGTRQSTGEAETWLEAAPKELRGWEWRHVKARVDRSLWCVALPGPGLACVCQPGGTTVACGGTSRDGGDVRLVDGRTGALRATLDGHRDRVRALAFSPDGARLASGGDDRRTRIWEVTTGRCLADLPAPAGVTALAFAPTGRVLATGTAGEAADVATLQLWSTDAAGALTLRREIAITTSRIWCIEFSPAADELLLGTTEGEVRTVALTPAGDLRDGEPSRVLAKLTDTVQAVAFGDRGDVLAGTNGAEVVRLDARDGTERGRIAGPARSRVVQFDLRAGLAAFVAQVYDGGDNRVTLLELDSGRPRAELLGNSYPGGVWGVAFSDDGERVFTSSWERELRAFDIDGAPAAATAARDLGGVTALTCRSGTLALGTDSGDVELWDPDVLLVRRHWAKVHGEPITGLWPTLDGGVLSAGGAGRICLSGPGDRPPRELARRPVAATALAGFGNGDAFAVGWVDGALTIHDRPDGAPPRELRLDDRILTVAADPTHERLAIAGLRNGQRRHTIVRVLANGRQRPRQIADLPGSYGEIAWLDHEHLALTGLANKLVVLNVGSGDVQVCSDQPPTGWRYHALAPLGRGRLVTANVELALRVWDQPRNEHVVALRLPTLEMRALAFVPARDALFGASRDGSLVRLTTSPATAGAAAATARRAWLRHRERQATRLALAANRWLTPGERSSAEAIIDRLTGQR